MNSAVFHKEISHSPLTNVIITWLSNYNAMDIHHNDCAEPKNRERHGNITTALLQHIFFKVLTWVLSLQKIYSISVIFANLTLYIF